MGFYEVFSVVCSIHSQLNVSLQHVVVSASLKVGPTMSITLSELCMLVVLG